MNSPTLEWYPVPLHFPHQVGVPLDDLPAVHSWLRSQNIQIMRDYLDIQVTVNGLHFIVFRDYRKATLCMLTWGKTSKACYAKS